MKNIKSFEGFEQGRFHVYRYDDDDVMNPFYIKKASGDIGTIAEVDPKDYETVPKKKILSPTQKPLLRKTKTPPTLELPRPPYYKDKAKFKNLRGNNTVELYLKYKIPRTASGVVSDVRNRVYILFGFGEKSRNQLVKRGYATHDVNSDGGAKHDPIYIFLNAIKGGTKYSNLINGNTPADLVTNLLVVDIWYEAARLIKTWWNQYLKTQYPPLYVIPTSSSNMQYPNKCRGNTFNEHWAKAIQKIMTKRIPVTIDNKKQAVQFQPKILTNSIEKEINPHNIRFDDTPYTDGDYEGGQPNFADAEQKIPILASGLVAINVKLQQMRDNWDAGLRDDSAIFSIKNFNQINRWRLSRMFSVNQFDEVKRALNASRERKILIIDDNIDTGATMFDIKKTLVENYKIPSSQIVMISAFEAQNIFPPPERLEVAEEISNQTQ